MAEEENKPRKKYAKSHYTTSDKVIARNKKATLASQEAHPAVKSTAEYIYHSMQLMQLPAIKLKTATAPEVIERTAQFFDICAQNDMKPTWESYALALGTSRKMLWNYVTGADKIPSDVLEVIQRAYSILNASFVDMATDGKINPVMAIFLLRNNMQYSNDDTSSKEELKSTVEEYDAKAIAAKYEDIID